MLVFFAKNLNISPHQLMKEFHFSPHGCSVREENFFHTRFLCYFVCFFRLTLRPSSTKNAIFLWFVKHCRHHHQPEKNKSVFLLSLSNACHRVIQTFEFGAHEEGRVPYFALHLEVNLKVLMKPFWPADLDKKTALFETLQFTLTIKNIGRT